MRYIWNQDTKENPCDLVSRSFGLTPLGKLLASPWAIGINGEAVDSQFFLGDLLKQPIREILEGERVQCFLKKKR